MTASLRIQILDVLQWMGFAIVLAALSFSNFFISFGSFWLVGVWLLNLLNAHFTDRTAGNYFRVFTSEPLYFVPMAIYMLSVVGLLWSSDFGFGMWDLRMKLPLLFMPFLIATLRPMSARALEWLFRLFIASLVVATLCCLWVYFGFSSKRILNIRDISIFISHIRFSMLLVFGAAIIMVRWMRRGVGVVIGTLVILLFVYFLWIIESVTGFTLLGALVFLYTLYVSSKLKDRWMKVGVPAVMIGLAVMSTMFVVHRYQRYFDAEEIPESSLDASTPRGEKYTHYLENKQLENGHYIMRFIAWNELKAAWDERSEIPFDSTDYKGNEVKWTLIRYITSLGKKKDLDAVEALSNDDIDQIERGIPSAFYGKKSGIDKRLDKIFFELDNYRNGGSPNGHSVFQRLEFWKTGSHIWKEHPWFGVGTGDLKSAFKERYMIDQTGLSEKNRLRAHNQYLTYFVGLGVFGGILFVVFFFYPVTRKFWRNSLVYMAFFVICLLSFITEDTLETQVGVTFYAFFHSFLVRYTSIQKSENSIR